MATKASFTPAEWAQLLESPMIAGMAVSAADPSGLFGMLKESIATGSALVHAKTDAATNQLVKAVADDFGTSEGRGVARDGLKAKLSGVKPAEIKAKAIELAPPGFCSSRRQGPRGRQPRSRPGSPRSARTSPRLPRRAGFWASAGSR